MVESLEVAIRLGFVFKCKSWRADNTWFVKVAKQVLHQLVIFASNKFNSTPNIIKNSMAFNASHKHCARFRVFNEVLYAVTACNRAGAA